MTQEVEVLFNYKGKDILIKKKGAKYFIGIRDQVTIWFEKNVYNSLQIARTSGREYARNIIDKMLISRKERKPL